MSYDRVRKEELCPRGEHRFRGRECVYCGTGQIHIALLVSDGVISVAVTRSDTDEILNPVMGCMTCGGQEDARYSFTALYADKDGKFDMSWLCQPCMRELHDSGADVGLLVHGLGADDIMARNPEMRTAYEEGRLVRTGDCPAGFVLKGENTNPLLVNA